jgi:hypothetical protein
MNATALRRSELIANEELPAISETVFNPEFEFLVACCSESTADRQNQFNQVLANNFDWDKMLKLAEHHRIISRIYTVLVAYSALVPAYVIDALRFRTQTNARQALLLTAELFCILDHLESRGIVALAYKGPALAQILYGDITARQFGDLDLLVRKSDVARAKTALLELGYRSSLDLSASEERAYLASGYEYTFNSEHGRNLIELKWQILPRFYSVKFDMDAMLARAISVDLEGHSVLTLCAEDLFLISCVHAAKHAWSELSLICDIAQLMKTQSLDWEIIRKRASELGIERIVAVNVLLANKFLGASIPAAIRSDPETSHLAEHISSMIAAGEEYDVESFSYFKLMISLRERWIDRVRLLLRLTFTPSGGEWSVIRLPAMLFPLYRIVRVVRLARRFASVGKPTAII